MRISHIAMYVQDLEVVKEFYIRFFGAKAGELYHNPKTGLKSYFLSFDEGTRLELMNLPGNAGSEESAGADGLYPYRNFSGKQRESGCHHRKTV